MLTSARLSGINDMKKNYYHDFPEAKNWLRKFVCRRNDFTESRMVPSDTLKKIKWILFLRLNSESILKK